MAPPQSGYSSTEIDLNGSNWNVEMLVFEERGKPDYPEKKPFGAGKRTNNKLNPHIASSQGKHPEPHRWP